MGRSPVLLLLVIITAWNLPGCAGTHTHLRYTTVMSKPWPGVPVYSTRRAVDDITLYWYDSHTQLMEVRAPWLKNAGVNLNRINYHEISSQLILQRYLQVIIHHLNTSHDYDILQKIEGCTIYDNGTVEGVLSEAYNGRLFVRFNVEASKWTTEIPEAEFFVEILNSNETENEDLQKELVERCKLTITRLQSWRNTMFSKREKPTVKVTGRPLSSDSLILSCKVYGHYPKVISLKWMRNGQQVLEEELQRLTLPLPDQTYLSLSALNVTAVTGDVYTCVVNHSSLDPSARQHWKVTVPAQLSGEHSGLSYGIVIVLSLTAAVLLSAVVLGLVAVEKHRRSSDISDPYNPPVFLITVKTFNEFNPSPNPPVNIITISGNIYDDSAPSQTSGS
ncbi:major histocompatibility complex class I-related gene protein-like [Hyperolius riggenbachi]|uniref:major histocompatibility complex class I-related gene protein-like n=1 Tax=Hyperolius riggenbachi TaxID=752182 RepID=UPI0035A2FF4E